MDVFITDALLRKSLSATRSLGRKGIKVGTGEKSWINPSGFSKYCSVRKKYPDPTKNPHHFLSWLTEELLIHQPVFLPMDDTVMEIVMENLGEIKQISSCLLPSKDAFRIASDKYKTMKLAKEQKVDCPVSYLIKEHGDLRDIESKITFPIIIKPCKSSGSRGIRKVLNQDELVKNVNEIKNIYPELMIQEFIPIGDRYDVCLLFNSQHEVKASFVQKEIRHFPIAMGPSTVQESVVNEELINRSIRLLKPLKWVGIVEIEYMIDKRTGIPQLMEINPRFWNSLDLAIKSGVDFPYYLYQLCKGENPTVQKDYEVGRRSRWFFPGDILHFLLNPKRFKMSPPFFSGKKQRVYDDTFSLEDPLPSLLWLIACFRFSFSLESWKMFFKR